MKKITFIIIFIFSIIEVFGYNVSITSSVDIIDPAVSGNWHRYLSVTSLSVPDGSTYQWQRSINGAWWEDMEGYSGTLPAYLTIDAGAYMQSNSIRRSTQYRLVINANGTLLYSNAVWVKVKLYSCLTSPVGKCQWDVINLNSLFSFDGGTDYYNLTFQKSLNEGDSWIALTSTQASNYIVSERTLVRVIQACWNDNQRDTSNNSKIYISTGMDADELYQSQELCSYESPALIFSHIGKSSESAVWMTSSDGINFTQAATTTYTYWTPPKPSEGSSIYIYKIGQLNNSQCPQGINSDTIKINTLPTVVPGTISADQTICYNNTPVPLTASSPTGGTGAYTYQWQSSTDNYNWYSLSNGDNVGYSPSSLTQTTYFHRIVTSGNCNSVTTNSITIMVYDDLLPGTISSDQTICFNTSPLQLTGTAPSGGYGLFTYQWQSSPDNNAWSDIQNAKQSNYTPPALTQTTYYRRAVTSGSCGTVYSNFVKITVHSNLISGTINSNQTICYNSTPVPLTASSPTGGTGAYTYQWQKSVNNKDWSNIPGASKLAYSPPALTQTMYYRMTTASGACGTVTSNVVTITVYGQLTPSIIGSDQSICNSTTPVSLNGSSPTGGTGSYILKWQSSPDNGSWSSIQNTNNLSYSPPELTETMYYRLAVTSGTCGTVYSNTTTILVYDPIIPGVISNNQIICYGSSPLPLTSTYPSGGTGNYNYQWQYSIDSAIWYSIPNEINNDYAPPSLTKSTYYRKIVNFELCGFDTTNSIKIKVFNRLVSGKVGSDQTICYNSTPVPLTASSPTGGTGAYTYQWQKSINNRDWEDLYNGNDSNYRPESLTNTLYFRRKETSGACGTVNSNQVLINVHQKISAGTLSCNQTILFNTLPSQLIGTYPTGGTGSYSYQWQKSNDSVNFNNINENGNDLNYQPLNLKRSIFYRRLDGFGSCGADTTNILKISVINNLFAGTISENQTICYSSIPELVIGSYPSGGSGSYNYQWQYSINDSTWENIGKNAQSSNYQPDSLKENTYLRRLIIDKDPEAGFVASNSILVSLYPKIEQPLTDELPLYCSKSNISINIKNPLNTLSYTWYNNKTLSKGTKLQLPNVTDNLILYLSASDINCSSVAKPIFINIDKINANFEVKVNAIVGEEIQFINASSNAVSYQWNFFDGTNSTEKEPFHRYSTTGTKDVQLTVKSENGCIDTITRTKVITVLNSTDIKNIKNDGFLIYPIPVQNILNIDLENKSDKFGIEIYDLYGKKIIQKTGIGKLQIDFESYPNGSYLLKIKSNFINQTIKILKNN